MTMRVKIENLGPDCYHTVISKTSDASIIKELKINESHELYVYPGNEVTISEVNAPK